MIVNVREQHPVGQGFFHSGWVLGLTFDQEWALPHTSFRYVYDCGAMAKYKVARNLEIANYRKTLEPGEEIDILFVSHAHADHINGVTDLLKGHRARTIMMPLLGHEDRLAALARTLAVDRQSATAFYRRFIADPADALGSLGPDRIIFVTSGEGGAPGSRDGAPLEPADGGPRPEGRSEQWKAVGRGGPRPMSAEQSSNEPGATNATTVVVEQMSDSCAVMVMTHTVIGWLLAPYVDPGVLADRKKFLKALARQLKTTTPALRKKLEMPEYFQTIVTTKTTELTAAYKALGRNLNLTSLCLYSGPIEAYPAVPGTYEYRFGGKTTYMPDQRATGWLATGDAELAEKARSDALLRHYGDHLDRVVTMTLPHHGSEANFSAELLSGIDPENCIAAADKIGKWRHPGSRVIQLVASAGKMLFVATSAVPSRFEEEVTLGT